MRRVALTGGIATGKSHVRARFEQLGVPTIDADVLSREAVAPGINDLWTNQARAAAPAEAVANAFDALGPAARPNLRGLFTGG